MSNNSSTMEDKIDDATVKILNHEVINAALLKDKGSEAILISWNAKRFTSKGDNYVCLVCCVKVSYKINETLNETSYCVKLNPCVDNPSIGTMFYEVFNKEGKFYFDLVPRLNLILEKCGFINLKVPNTLMLQMDKDRECMFMEDLRQYGFEIHNRTVGLDVAHVVLVIQELARLHASSMLLHLEQPETSLMEKYPYLENLLETSPGMRHLFDMFSGFMYGLADIAEELQGYENVAIWIKKILPDLYQNWSLDINQNPKFTTVCHGDIWCNNVLFKYNKYGSPMDVRLLDLQLCNVGSLMQDITLFLFSSLRGINRRNHIQCFLNSYYASFSAVFAGADHDIPFTKEELYHEYYRMYTYGITMGMICIQITMKSEDIPDFPDGSQNSSEGDQIASQRRQVVHSFATNQHLRSRALELFNDIMINNKNPIYIL